MLKLTRRTFAALAASTMLAMPALAQDAAPFESLAILAPSSAGSGYDQLARAIQQALTDEGLASGIEVENVAGGGGTVGLAQLVTSNPRGPAAMVLGFALVGGT